MLEPALLLAMALDALAGWPGGLYRVIGHPVGLFARVIGVCERTLNREAWSSAMRRSAGIVTVLVLALIAGGGGWALEAVIRWLCTPWLATLCLGALAWPGLAQRSLYVHFTPVRDALMRGDLPAARRAVAMIVGRDTARLDEDGVARAAIESLAESFCDGVVAPLFWLVVGGLPGLWFYKAVNTADSLIGHREAPYTHFGWAAARLDDLLNLIPARLSGVLICLAGVRRESWGVMLRDHDRHASPNAGWPEAAMAGVLGVRLAGPVSYDGDLYAKPWIGEGAPAGASSMQRAGRVYLRACALLWAMALVVIIVGERI